MGWKGKKIMHVYRSILNQRTEAIAEGTDEKKINLDELQREVEKLQALLNDRQPGHMSWNQLLHERLQNLHALIAPIFTS
jgi:uncharacterized protein YlxW (UPF0749 family)